MAVNRQALVVWRQIDGPSKITNSAQFGHPLLKAGLHLQRVGARRGQTVKPELWEERAKRSGKSRLEQAHHYTD